MCSSGASCCRILPGTRVYHIIIKKTYKSLFWYGYFLSIVLCPPLPNFPSSSWMGICVVVFILHFRLLHCNRLYHSVVYNHILLLCCGMLSFCTNETDVVFKKFHFTMLTVRTVLTDHCRDSLLVERRAHVRKAASSNPGSSGGIIFFSRVNFMCWLLFDVRSTPVLPQWHVKHPGHSAKVQVAGYA